MDLRELNRTSPDSPNYKKYLSPLLTLGLHKSVFSPENPLFLPKPSKLIEKKRLGSDPTIESSNRLCARVSSKKTMPSGKWLLWAKGLGGGVSNCLHMSPYGYALQIPKIIELRDKIVYVHLHNKEHGRAFSFNLCQIKLRYNNKLGVRSYNYKIWHKQ